MDINNVNGGIGKVAYKEEVKSIEKISSFPGIENQNKESNQDIDAENKKYEEKDVKEAVDIFDKLLKKHGTHVEYEKHDKFNTIMIKIIDNNTGDVVQEVPPKKILDMVAKMCEFAGVLLDKKA